MPTADRRLRPRRRVASEKDDAAAVLRLLHEAAAGRVSWDAIRARCVRGMTGGAVRAEQAASLFEAYRRRPILLPMLPPPGRA
jgi:hypothetical protein